MSGIFRSLARLTADTAAFQTRLPNQFRCQTSNSSLSRDEPALGLLKPAGTVLAGPACFQVEALFTEDVELEAANDLLVELTGIEPVTPCLQSRCSPS